MRDGWDFGGVVIPIFTPLWVCVMSSQPWGHRGDIEGCREGSLEHLGTGEEAGTACSLTAKELNQILYKYNIYIFAPLPCLLRAGKGGGGLP